MEFLRKQNQPTKKPQKKTSPKPPKSQKKQTKKTPPKANTYFCWLASAIPVCFSYFFIFQKGILRIKGGMEKHKEAWQATTTVRRREKKKIKKTKKKEKKKKIKKNKKSSCFKDRGLNRRTQDSASSFNMTWLRFDFKDTIWLLFQ